MNAIIQAFLNQIALFTLMAVLHICYFYQGKVEHLNPLKSKVDLILFIVIWFGVGTYLTFKFNWGIWA